MKISVITPSFNSGIYLEKAIQSVLVQDYDDYEHIIVDGGSTDNTIEILKEYDHLRWISEPDKGQVDAMNKGFRMARGDVLVYLNADDYFLEGAFSAVMPHFKKGAWMVMGKVKVYTQKTDNEWTNDPKTDFDSMMRHWEGNAFCVNPVGYFYRKEVQAEFPYNEDNDAKQDLEFLIDVASKYEIVKIDRVLGVFFDNMDAKTFKDQIQLDYWRPGNFPFVERHLQDKSEEYIKDFRVRQAAGYQLRTQWTIQDCFRLGLAEEAYRKGELIPMPEWEFGMNNSRVMDTDCYLTAGDAVVIFLSYGEVASQAVCHTLMEARRNNISPYPVYHLQQFSPKGALWSRSRGCYENHMLNVLPVRRQYDRHRNTLRWKFINGVREPISFCLSNYWQMQYPTKGKPNNEELEEYSKHILKWQADYFDRVYKGELGIDVYAHPFDRNSGYNIIKSNNTEVLTYRSDDIEAFFPDCMKQYLGIQDLKLIKNNITKKKSSTQDYIETKRTFKIKEDTLRKIYSHKSVTHFYSEAEIEGFIEQWKA